MLLEQTLDVCQTRTQTALGFAQAGQPALAAAELERLCEDLNAALAPAPAEPPEPKKQDGDTQ